MPRKTALKCYFGCDTEGPFHQFPNPNNSIQRFNEWKAILSDTVTVKGDQYIFNCVRLCDNHFAHYYRSTSSKRLTKHAIPTLNLCSTSRSDSVPMNVDMPADLTIQSELSNKYTVENTPIYQVDVNQTRKEMGLCSKKSSFGEINQLRQKIIKLRNKCKTLNEKIRMASKLSQNEAFLKAMERLPEPAAIFTKMQMNQYKKLPRGRRYTINEKIMCLTILKQSQKAYNLLQRLFILPSKRSLQKILSSISLQPGVNDCVIEHLKKAVKKLSEEKKICSVIFDEVALSPGIHFQRKLQEIIGFEDFGNRKTKKIADHALVFMIKSLKGKFKQPVAFTFCQSSTKAIELKIIIKDVIEKVRSTGLIVIVTVCDQSNTNISAINSLLNETTEMYTRKGIEYKSTAFELHDQKVFHIYDPPHLLKGLRNNLLNKDLKFVQNGEIKIAKWHHLQMLLDVDTGEDDIRLVNKLTESHVNKDKIPKMKVKHAAQVFSQRVSAAMRFLSKHNILPKECEATADLLLLIDKLFDTFNSNNYKDTAKTYRTALKVNSPHFKLWEEVLPVLKSMEFISKKNGTEKYVKVPSIKNFINNIYVMRELFKYLLDKHGISSLLTRNINQDPLENFFCNIRSNGVRNISPTCSQFIGAYKTLLVNNLTSPHSVGANCEQDNNKMMRPLKKLIKMQNKTIEKPNNDGPLNVDSLVNIFTNEYVAQPSNIVFTEAKRYVAGYLVKKCLSKVSATYYKCKSELLSTTPPTNKDYIFLRDYTGKSCKYPSEALCSFLNDVFIIIETELKEDPHLRGLKDTIIKKIEIFCYSGFITCEIHKNKMYKYLISLTIDVVVHSWCANVNRLLKGKITKISDQNNYVKNQAINYYNAHKSKRK